MQTELQSAEGKKKGGRRVGILGFAQQMHPTKDEANDEDSGESQHQCSDAKPALAVSRAQHRVTVLQRIPHLKQLWSSLPLRSPVAPQQRLCWPKFPPTTALGKRSIAETFSSPRSFWLTQPIVVRLRKCLPPKKKTQPLLSDAFSLKLY